MSQNVNLKKIERKAYLSYFEDGLWDVLVGSFILCFGIDMATGSPSSSFVFPSFLVLGWGVKRWVTYPRIGYVKFAPARLLKIRKSMGRLTLLLLLTALSGLVPLFALSGRPGLPADVVNWVKEHALLLFGGVWAIVVAALALLFEVKRFYAYAALVMGSFVGGHLFDVEPYWYFLVPGGLVVLSGLVMLIRFLSMYPIPTQGATSNTQAGEEMLDDRP
jgi:hypothetical protein